MRAAAGRLLDGGGGVTGTRVHRRLCPDRGRQGQRAGRDVDGHHPGAGGDRDLHRGQPDAAAAVHGDPLARADLPDLHDGPERGRDAAPQSGGRHEGQAVGERDEVDVGGVQRDELGEGAAVGEAGLGLLRADLLLTCRADRAPAAGADERDGHPVPRPPAAHPVADRLDRARELVAGHVRQRDVGVVPLPAVPVAAAHAGGADPDHDAVRRGHRVGQVDERQRAGVRLELQGPHGSIARRSPMPASSSAGVSPSCAAAPGSRAAASSNRP